MTLGKLVLPLSVVCRLTLITWLEPSAGVSITQPLTLYTEPGYILLLTLIWGPSQFPMRPVVRRLWAPECAAAVLLATVELPERELQPSVPPSSKSLEMPLLSCWLGFGGGGASSLMATLLM